MKIRRLELKDKYVNMISSRVSVKNLFQFDAENLEELTIDFSNIFFISSSAAHQFVIEINELHKNAVDVQLINIVADVKRMIDLAGTDRKNIFTTQPVEIIRAANEKELNKLLQ